MSRSSGTNQSHIECVYIVFADLFCHSEIISTWNAVALLISLYLDFIIKTIPL